MTTHTSYSPIRLSVIAIVSLFVFSTEVSAASGSVPGIQEVYRLDRLPVLKESIKVASISSYDRTGGNNDGFGGQYSFVRKEKDGLVLADLQGPGVIYRIWTPTPTDDMLEFYFDDETEPSIQVKFRDLFMGKHPVFVRPLVGYGAGGFYSYVPLTYEEERFLLQRELDRSWSTLRLEEIPLDDVAAYQIFVNGNTTSVFQFESRGMRDLVQRARPDRFEDIIALVALFRPGPMDLIPDFVERKHGRQRVVYPDPRVEPILSETYGIMVYQEQVMQMAQIIGGYSLGGADLLRRAMGKKKPEEMAKHRVLFLEGAAKNGLSAHKGNEIFDLMEKFAGYGFNKSHAAAYALVAYHTAWFKAHHPAPFMAANFSAVMDDTDKVQQFYVDCISNGLKVLPPDIHESEYRFVPVDEKSIRYGLGAVKGTGEAAIEHIIAERANGPFADLFDFCRRVDRRLVNRRVIESLVRAGAFDSVDEHRARLFASVGIAMAAADQESRAAAQVSLFSDEAAPVGGVAMVDAAPWDERLRLQNEKLALGFYYSGHPFHYYEREFASFVSTRLDRFQAPPPEEGARTQLMAGVVESVRVQRTGNGRMMVMVVSDGTASQEVVVYDEVLNQHRNLVKEDAVVLIEAKVRSFRRGGDNGESSVFVRIAAERIFDLAGARERFGRSLRLAMNGAADASRLKQLLEPYRNGALKVCVAYTSAKAQAEFDLGEDWKVRPDDALIAELGKWLEPENVQVVYQ